jgi:hypothetical protein
VTFRGTIGCLPAALALRTAGWPGDPVGMPASVAPWLRACSGIGEIVLSCVKPRIVGFGAASLDEDCAAPVGGCGLGFRCDVAWPVAAVGFEAVLSAPGSVFVVIGNSNPVVAVLPDEGMSLSLPWPSSDSGGDTNRAVGLGPVVSGLLAFFKMG